MTVDRSRGVDRQASSSTTNRIKKDGIPPGGLDTLTPERDGRSDISASPGNTPAGLGLGVCVCIYVCALIYILFLGFHVIHTAFYLPSFFPIPSLYIIFKFICLYPLLNSSLFTH